MGKDEEESSLLRLPPQGETPHASQHFLGQPESLPQNTHRNKRASDNCCSELTNILWAKTELLCTQQHPTSSQGVPRQTPPKAQPPSQLLSAVSSSGKQHVLNAVTCSAAPRLQYRPQVSTGPTSVKPAMAPSSAKTDDWSEQH